MKPNKRALSLIGFKRDYDIHKDFQTHSFEVRSGDIRSRMKVGVSFGDSAEFLLVETYDKLDKVRRRDTPLRGMARAGSRSWSSVCAATRSVRIAPLWPAITTRTR